MSQPSLLSKLFSNKFHLLLLGVLAVIFIQQAMMPYTSVIPSGETKLLDPASVHVFYHPECPHCAEEMNFLQTLKFNYPELTIETHDITRRDSLALFMRYAEEHAISSHALGTPLLVIGEIGRAHV